MVELVDEMELQWKVCIYLTFDDDKLKLNLCIPGKLLTDRNNDHY